MKQVFFSFFLIVLMSMVGARAYAYDIAVENADGVKICYNYINDAKDLEVTYYGSYNYYTGYSGSVVIPEEVSYMNRTRKVTRIGNKAFFNCSGLTSVAIPNSVKIIGEYAFQYCSRLTSIIIGNNVISIGDRAFSFCSSLTAATIPNSVKTIGERAFEVCSGLTSIIIPSSVTTIGAGAFESCSGLTSVTIPNSVTAIGDDCFHSCISLSSITIPNSVTTIGDFAFYDCSGLTLLTIPNNVTTIGKYAFCRCSGLISVTIGNSVTTIEQYAFSNCSNMTSVTIGNSVTTIGDAVFTSCSSLTSITIPNSITTIGNGAFACGNLPVVISLIKNPFSINGKNSIHNTFTQNTFNNATLYVPVGTINKYKNTEGWKDFLYIEEGTGGGGTSTPKKCEKPEISYSNGKLKFTSGTEGASCQYNITDTDIKSGSGNEVQLTVTYSISAYATKTGYDNSETVTATLCWIDVNPKTEGIESAIANVRANPVLIQSNGGVLNISGINDGADIVVYSVFGQMVGSSKAMGNQASVFTNMKKGEIAIVKIGDKSVKVAIQ